MSDEKKSEALSGQSQEVLEEFGQRALRADGGITAGAAYLKAVGNTPDNFSPFEMAEAIIEGQDGHTGYLESLQNAVKRGETLYEGDFHVILLMRRDRILQNVLRDMFFPRKSCPTPTYDQTVFYFHRDTGDLEFLWTLPAKEVCKELIRFYDYLTPEEKALANHVIRWRNGDLLKIVKRINKEEVNRLPRQLH